MDPAVQVLDLAELRGNVGRLSPEVGGCMALAAAVCLDESGHCPGVSCEFQYDADRHHFTIDFPIPSAIDRDSFADAKVATEWGACGVAIVAIRATTDLKVIKQSVKGTGFDWWLGTVDSELFQETARLEVSGIRAGSETQIASRLKQKTNQSKPSDKTGLLAIGAVVEFSRPVGRVATR